MMKVGHGKPIMEKWNGLREARLDIETLSTQSAFGGSGHPVSNSLLPRPTISVIVCTRSRSDLLRRCLEGVRQLDPSPDEVIVVDNTEGDRATESVARDFGARCIVEPIGGLSRARNRALAESKSEIVAYLDDDAVPYTDWLSSILEPFRNPEVAIVTGRTVPPECEDELCEIQTRFLSSRDAQWFEKANFGALGIGANMALRKDSCLGWKVFDERLGRGAPFHGNEEHHAVARLLSIGFSAVHTPAAVVVHPVREGSVEQEASSAMAYCWLLFFEFPEHRFELVRFLIRRLRRKPLTWHRNPPGVGRVLSSGWLTRLKAGLAGTLLYLRFRKSKIKATDSLLCD
jgi:glycosyltransferase involved in cell wall biosynthesis